MLIRIACPSCGENGEDAASAEGNVLACPGCGTRLILTPLDDEEAVASWVGLPSSADRPKAAGAVAVCLSCGYEGPMLDDVSLGYPVCPACGASQRDRMIGKRLRVNCPECRQSIEAERGKSVVCPHCQTFHGCLIPEERRRRWWQRSR